LIYFEIPGDPKAWQRARTFGKRFFNSPEMTHYKNRVAVFAQNQGIKPVEGCIILHVDFYFKRPKKWCKPKAPQCALYMPSRPDTDNLIKMIGDGLNGVAWHDDGQIVEVKARKYYHEIGGSARTEVKIFLPSENVMKST
jgi:Holliday junction resolvase RusA-like endonuclease